MAVSAAANALISLADLKYLWGRAQDDTAHDDRAQTLINYLSGRIAEWCGRTFLSTTYTAQKFDHDGGYELLLPQYPITALSALSIDGTAVDVAASVASGDLLLYGDEGYIRYEPGFPSGHRHISVTYTAGYASGSFPSGLSLICGEWVIILLEARMKDAKVKQEDSKLDPPDRIATALAPYKRRDF